MKITRVIISKRSIPINTYLIPLINEHVGHSDMSHVCEVITPFKNGEITLLVLPSRVKN